MKWSNLYIINIKREKKNKKKNIKTLFSSFWNLASIWETLLDFENKNMMNYLTKLSLKKKKSEQETEYCYIFFSSVWFDFSILTNKNFLFLHGLFSLHTLLATTTKNFPKHDFFKVLLLLLLLPNKLQQLRKSLNSF